MNLSQLRYFRKLAQVQHFTRAAEELFITQPALSNSIKQLEGELGIPLFEQHGRNVRLTKFGKEFNEYVSEGLDVIEGNPSSAGTCEQSVGNYRYWYNFYSAGGLSAGSFEGVPLSVWHPC